MDRRSFLRLGLVGAGSAVLGPRLLGSALPMAWAADGPYGPLQLADSNGVQLPAGFTSRIVARSGQAVGASSYVWHSAPDGGACFSVPGGGWVYACNSELGAGAGGVGVLRFGSDGSVTGAYRVLSGTSRNCAGGATPWGTWLSCEEVADGRVWECDPLGTSPAVVRPAMGRFNHEAAAVDQVGQAVYLTEDASDGRLYRFRPSAWPDLATGTLEVATVSGSSVTWSVVADPDGTPTATRNQVAGSTAFNGGEGAWYADGKLWFTAKGDNRVWELDVRASPQTIRVIYDDSTSPNPILTGVDNIVGSVSGDLFVAEDPGEPGAGPSRARRRHLRLSSSAEPERLRTRRSSVRPVGQPVALQLAARSDGQRSRPHLRSHRPVPHLADVDDQQHRGVHHHVHRSGHHLHHPSAEARSRDRGRERELFGQTPSPVHGVDRGTSSDPRTVATMLCKAGTVAILAMQSIDMAGAAPYLRAVLEP